MNLGLSRTLGTTEIPVWQGIGKDIQLAQGGFLLDNTGLVSGAVIPAGTPVVYNEATRKAAPLRVATLHANATNIATTYQIEKGSDLKVGDYLAASVGGAAYAITVIDTSNTAYDVVTVGTTLGVALTAPHFLFASSATGASAAALGGVNGLLYEDLTVDTTTNQSCSVVIRGTVYARRVPYSTDLVTALPHIIYSQSY
jgi:hypothetical protein